ncbi:MAG TPA: Rv3654c family TadE-like protein [Actinophytocola sp.]|uniref:Rv3654c family TadE-like protein n=1 Tax=Actinophytocola sp. TaxID=1872138 RepID=UPI002DB7F8F7|nr:Rv3654c family TadE-like protein [Actinophytocola sp.]HEU5474314.1 Rv3654c family TadE-like protein [Actinophytocola sp.]
MRSHRRNPAARPHARSADREPAAIALERTSAGNPTPPARGRPPDQGSASVWAAGAIAAILVVLGLILGIGAAAHTRHRAASAADLAALAAAAHAVSGVGQACARAEWVASQMRVRLAGCRLTGWTAEVEIVAPPPDLLLGYGSATARARAGPVDGTPSASGLNHHG